MENVVLNITIGERNKTENFLEFYKKQGIDFSLGTYGTGTASKEKLDLLGLDSVDKCILFSLMTMDKSKSFLHEIENSMQLKTIGAGLSFTVPLSSIDSLNSLKRYVKEIDEKKEDEGYDMDTENELIVVIANRGFTENVMEVARKAGAQGGTVVHARGTHHESDEKFFGTAIGAEKEMIFIVAKEEKTKDIMQAIKNEVGVNTPSGAVSFSLPINDTAGIIYY
ncbi:MAG: P-II family nitrogen regulator [Clostridia bacterium]|nr:P-II family nitrogen regulator [Clostridia bacterium]